MRAGRTAVVAAGAVLAACAAVVWSTPGDAYWIADCGSKALVAQRLLDSNYADASFDYPAARFDPEGRFFPIPVPFVLERGSRRVSVFGPAYAALAAPGLGALVAWIGLLVLLLAGVDTWKDIVENHRAWDCLVRLGGLLAMANVLKSEGIVDWFGRAMQTQVAGLSGIAVVLALGLIYFYSMYAFSMLTAHISALVGAFFGVALAAGAPPLLTVGVFAYFSSLCGCMTNYSTGPVIIYFGLGFVETGRRSA